MLRPKEADITCIIRLSDYFVAAHPEEVGEGEHIRSLWLVYSALPIVYCLLAYAYFLCKLSLRKLAFQSEFFNIVAYIHTLIL